METVLSIPSILLWLLLLVVLTFRYIIVAGLPYLWLFVIGKNKYKTRKLQKEIPNKGQIVEEVKLSLLTICIYSCGIWLFLYWLKHDYTRNYTDINEYGWVYFFLSIVVMIIMHDAYSYWTHRLIHHKILFKYVHALHHKFKNPTPWSAFAFHPLESLLTLGIIPIVMFIIPWNHTALIIFITLIIVYDTFIHLGYNFEQLKIFKWQNTPKDHDVHHRNSKFNFGLYFTYWDRLMGTYFKD